MGTGCLSRWRVCAYTRAQRWGCVGCTQVHPESDKPMNGVLGYLIGLAFGADDDDDDTVDTIPCIASLLLSLMNRDALILLL